MSFEVDVAKRVGEAEIRVAFSTGPGLTVLFGPSGSGKTSLLNMVAGLLRPDAGHIHVAGESLFGDGIDLPPEERRAGYVFQDRRLFPHLSVRANLAYGQRTDSAPVMVLEAAARFLGIAHLLDRKPATLSGGEAQRVAIGRALLSSPRFLLMDEPLVALDRARAGEIMGLIEQIRDEMRLPILYVTHSPAEVERLATTVVDIAR